MEEIFAQILHLREHGEEAMLVTVVEREGAVPAPPGTKMLVYPDGRTLGTVGGGALEKAATAHALELLKQRRSELVRYALTPDERALDEEPTGMICGGRAALFYDYLGYGHYLYLLGGGHVGRAVARHAKSLPFYITVIDHRADMGPVEGAHRLLIGDYEALLADEAVPAGSYFLIATPSHAYDYVALRRIMSADWRPAYVGMIGSRQKAETSIRQLAQELGPEVNWEVLYCPVGLDIGGRSPDEIAISILAEIQAVRHGKGGQRHMRLDAALLAREVVGRG
ncbi:MAG: XdhC family protein [Chloroflexi bacterium]|nr:XdhC family protein [Chloroflexota bacterium]